MKIQITATSILIANKKKIFARQKKLYPSQNFPPCVSRQKKTKIQSAVRREPLPHAAALVESERRRVRPGGGRADPRGRLAPPPVRLRVLPASPRVAGLSADDSQALHRPQVHPPAARSLRQRGPARARLSQDHPAQDLRQVPRAPGLHTQADQQRVLSVYLRDRAPQRHCRAP